METQKLNAFVAGGVAGTLVDLAFFPIDTIKARMQSSKGFVNAGGRKGVYRGVASVFMSAPSSAMFFTVYEYSQSKLSTSETFKSTHATILAACLAELAACTVRVPTDLVKQRMQISSSKMSNIFKELCTRDGLRALKNGFGITVMREIPFACIQFPVFEFLKSELPFERKGAMNIGLSGLLAASLAAFITTPIDVLRTRAMTKTLNDQGSFWSLGSQIYRHNGVKGFFAGVVPRVIWIGCGGIVFLGSYEFAKKWLDENTVPKPII